MYKRYVEEGEDLKNILKILILSSSPRVPLNYVTEHLKIQLKLISITRIEFIDYQNYFLLAEFRKNQKVKKSKQSFVNS